MSTRIWIVGFVPLGATLVLTLSDAKGWLDVVPDWSVALLCITTGWGWLYLLGTSNLAKGWAHAYKWRMVMVFVLIGMMAGGLSGWLLWWSIRRGTIKAISTQTAAQEERVAASIRLKYSSTQTIEVSNEPGNHNDILNLDNVATMVQTWDSNLEQVGMLLTTSPPLRVDDPKGGIKYPSGPEGWKVEFPAADTPGIEIKSARTLYDKGDNYFLFHRLKARTHVIAVGVRKFRVTLLDIRDRSDKKKKRMLIQYTFGISEE